MAKINTQIGYIGKICDISRVIYQNLNIIPEDIVRSLSRQITAFSDSISNLSFRKG